MCEDKIGLMDAMVSQVTRMLLTRKEDTPMSEGNCTLTDTSHLQNVTFK